MIKRFTPLLALALLPLATLSAKPKAVNFSEFKGTYQGTIVFTNNVVNPGLATGPISISIAVPRSGNTATATVNGFVSAGSTSAPIVGTLAFTKSSIFGSDALFNFPQPVGAFSVPGALSKNGFTVNAATSISGTAAQIQSTIRVKASKKKKTLTISFTVSNGGGFFYTYQFTASGKVKK